MASTKRVAEEVPKDCWEPLIRLWAFPKLEAGNNTADRHIYVSTCRLTLPINLNSTVMQKCKQR